MTGFARYCRGESFEGGCRGLPGSNSLSFASPKESKQRKGDPQSSSLRFATGNLRCSVTSAVRRTRLRLKQLRPLYADSTCAPRRGQQGVRGIQKKTLASSASRLRLPESEPEFMSPPVEAGPSSADGGGRSGQTCLSEASCLDRRRSRAAQVARSAAKGPRRRVAFLLVTFSLAKQRKVTCRRATPGLVVKGTTPTKALIPAPTTRGQI